MLAGPQYVIAGPDHSLYVADTANMLVRMIDAQGNIYSIAGTGYDAYMPPLNGNAREVSVKFPMGMTVASDGSVYFVEFKGFVVRRLDLQGNLTIVAGGRALGPSGDGGPATRAALNHPTDVLVDPRGRMYVAEVMTNRVRMIDERGIIHTVAGNGELGNGGDGGRAIDAQLSHPESLAFDIRGNLLIAGGATLRVINLETGIIQTVRGAEGAGYVATDKEGAIYFSGKNIVMRLEGDGPPEVVAGVGYPGFGGDGGRAVNAQLNTPQGLSVDDEGYIYIADTGNHRIRRVSPSGVIETFAGNGKIPGNGAHGSDGGVRNTNGMAFDRFGDLYYSDHQWSLIWRLSTDGVMTVVAGNRVPGNAGDGGHPLDAAVSQPRAFAFDSAGNLLFIDEGNNGNNVRRITPGADGVINGSDDEVIESVVGIPGEYERRLQVNVYGVHPGEAVLNSPRGLCLDPEGNLFIADWLDHRVVKVYPGADGVLNGDADEVVTVIAGTGERGITGNGGPAVEASLSYPWWLACDSRGNVFVYEYSYESDDPPNLRAIRKIDMKTGFIDLFAHMAGTMAFDRSDNLYVADSGHVYRFDAVTGKRDLIAGVGNEGWASTTGRFSGDGGDARRAEFDGLNFFAIDLNGDIYAMDSGNGRIRKISFVPLDPSGPSHPVPQATWAPAITVPEPVQMHAPATPTPFSDPHFELVFIRRIGANEWGERLYEFRAEGFNISSYDTRWWGVYSDCDVTGWGGDGEGLLTIGVARTQYSTSCTLEVHLPNGMKAETTFLHTQFSPTPTPGT